MPQTAAPYWRLSAYYFVYFAALGAFLPYWTLYLEHRGFSALEIGQLMAILAGTKIIAPYLWGWVADHSGQRLRLIQFGALFAALCFIGVYYADSLALMSLVMLLFSFFWNAGLPQFEATTLHFLGKDCHRYSHIRLWGSIGFIITVLCFGPLLDRAGVSILPHLVLGLFLLIWFSTLHVPAETQPTAHTQLRYSVIPTIRQPTVLVILCISFLMQFSFGPYYAFFSIFLEANAYSKSSVGLLWSLGVIAEIFVFLNMHRLLARFDSRYLLLFCFAATIIRWFVVANFIDQPWLIVATQLLHAFNFGMYHAVMIHLIHRYFPAPLQGRGQALYSSLSFGAGGALGAFIAGYAWDSYGGGAVFQFAAGVGLVGMLLSLFLKAEHH